MSDPVTLLVVSTALSAGATVMGGVAGAKAAKIEQAQAEQAAKDRQLQGRQEANAIRDEADRVRRRNIALRAASGLGLESGSFMTIQSDVQQRADDDVKNVEFQAAAESNRYNLQAKQSGIESRSRLIGGIFGGTTTLLRGGYDYKTNATGAKKGLTGDLIGDNKYLMT